MLLCACVGALEQGAERIAGLAITDSHLAHGHTGSPRTLPSPRSTPRLETQTPRANSTNSTPRFKAVGEASEGVDAALVLPSPWGGGGGGGWRDLFGEREAVEEGLQEEEDGAGIAGYIMDASSPLEVCALCVYVAYVICFLC